MVISVPVKDNYVRTVLVIAAVIVLVVALKFLGRSLLPFFVAFLISSLIDPVVSFLERRVHLARSLAVLVTLFAIVVVAGYLLSFVFIKTTAELADLINKLPAYRKSTEDLVSEIIAGANTLNENLPPVISTNIQNTLENFLKRGIDLVNDVVNRLIEFAASLPSLTIVLVVTLLATYFFSRDGDKIFRAVVSIAPRQWQKRLNDIREKVLVDITGFVRGEFILMLITTVISATGLLLLAVPYWMILALILGIVDFIPVIGPGIVLFPWMLIAFLLGNIRMVVGLALLFAAILLTRQFLQPTILGDSVGIHPLVMMMGMYVGIDIFGVAGIMIAPVILILVKAVWHSVYAVHQRIT